MPMICFASPKGGVGKTTLTANVAAALKDLGRRVLVVDFDIQNALRLHFGLGLSEHRGFAADFEAEAEADWRRIALPTASGVTVIPFGTVGNSALGLVADALAADPTWLERRLAGFLADRDTIILADTPPGPSIFLDQITRLADFRVVVLLADATSIALIPRIDSGQFFGSVAGSLPAGALPARDPAVRYVVNQIDTRRRLGRDMLSFLRGQLGDRLIGGAYRDEAVAEAIATGVTVGAYAPQSRAAHDFHEIGLTLDHLLASPPSPPPSPALRRAGSGRALP